MIKTFLSENGNSSSILWIERLLQTPLPKFRKYCVWRILAPYLINVKHLSFEESFDIIDKWLDKCNELEALDFDTDTKINDCLNGAVNKGLSYSHFKRSFSSSSVISSVSVSGGPIGLIHFWIFSNSINSSAA